MAGSHHNFTSKELRSDPRYPCHLEITLLHTEDTPDIKSEDISLTGLMVRSNHTFQTNDHLWINILLPVNDKDTINAEMSVRVKWVLENPFENKLLPNKVGLEICDLGPAASEHWDSLIDSLKQDWNHRATHRITSLVSKSNTGNTPLEDSIFEAFEDEVTRVNASGIVTDLKWSTKEIDEDDLSDISNLPAPPIGPEVRLRLSHKVDLFLSGPNGKEKAFLLTLVNGTHRMRDIIDIAPFDSEFTRVLLAEMMDDGIILS